MLMDIMKKGIKQIIFTRINTAELVDLGVEDFSDIGNDEVVIRNVYTTISAGTERANITGDLNVSPVIQTVPQFPRVPVIPEPDVVYSTSP